MLTFQKKIIIVYSGLRKCLENNILPLLRLTALFYPKQKNSGSIMKVTILKFP